MTSADVDPIDATHVQSMYAIDRIRRAVAARRAEIARWRPRPCPKDFR